ncbi:M3 family metallopeptidase [Candidatus Dependentiae bacterium]
MRKNRFSFLFGALCTGSILGFYVSGVLFSKDNIFDNYRFTIQSRDDVVALFPKSADAITKQKERIFACVKKSIEEIIVLPDEDRNFENTVFAIDRALHDLTAIVGILETVSNVYPSKEIRDVAQKAEVEVGKFRLDVIISNEDLYKAFTFYVDNKSGDENLSSEQRYFLEIMLDIFKRGGLGLPKEEFDKVKNINKDLVSLCADFLKNVNLDNRFILAKEDELSGLEKDFIEGLKQDEAGLRIVGIDRPTYFNVMRNCTNGHIRKKLYAELFNRGYPKNDDVLKEIIKKRDHLARLLGYDSYAHLDCSDQMMCSPDKVEYFVGDLFEKASGKSQKEFELFVHKLNGDIELTKDAKIKPWDVPFAISSYKKKYLDIDENKIAQYFPMEKALKGLMEICSKFFHVQLIEESNTGLWHDDVKVLKVVGLREGDVLGYLVMDLYPRKDKFPHACMISVLPGVMDKHGQRNCVVASVIANLPKPTAKNPSLLKLLDVRTFFHEVGHALHSILSATRFSSLSGTKTKKDFVEVPSKLMELFIEEPEVLKMLSCHYETKEPLPDELIEKIVETKHVDYGYKIQTQLYYAMISLDLFKEGANKNPKDIIKNLHEKMLKNIEYADFTNMHTRFIHLTAYGAKYYGYIWSQVLAVDIFDCIKKHGLLNSQFGQKYADDILSKGGSVDPNVLVRNFLGREPNNKAFIENYGFN